MSQIEFLKSDSPTQTLDSTEVTKNAHKIKNVNLKKALKDKNWLVYKGENTLIIDDVKGLELICKPNIPINITGIRKELIRQSATFQRNFNTKTLQTITPQEAKRLSELPTMTNSKISVPVNPVGSRKENVNEIEIDITDEIIEDLLKGSSLEKLYKTHPNSEIIANGQKGRDLLIEELKRILQHQPQTSKSLMSDSQYVSPTLPEQTSEIHPIPLPEKEVSTADQFRSAGHRAVDAITDLLVAYKKF